MIRFFPSFGARIVRRLLVVEEDTSYVAESTCLFTQPSKLCHVY